jgi:tetratricopeptide (TPR) repeat protein
VGGGADELLERAAALEEEGYQAFKAGEDGRSQALNAESLDLARRAGDPAAEARALAGLMRLCLRRSDWQELERLAVECDGVAERSGDPSLRRMPLHMRAEAARMRGELEQAAASYDASIALNRELGDERMVGIEQANKSWVAINSGRLDEAETLLRGARERVDEDDAYGQAFCLLGLARGELERADAHGALLLAEAERLLEAAGLVWDPAERPEYERTRALAGG